MLFHFNLKVNEPRCEKEQAGCFKEFNLVIGEPHIKLSSEEAEAMIEFADSDEDGLITFEDFV